MRSFPLRSRYFSCPDIKTQAFFIVEPAGLVEGSAMYKREMSILDKIKEKPGMTSHQILNTFGKQEREEVFPPLHPTLVDVMLEELADADYIELKRGKAYPKVSSPARAKGKAKTKRG